MKGQIRYQSIWARLYLFFGILFSIIFLLGYAMLDDITYLLYTGLGVFIVFMGRTMRKSVYATYSEKEFIIYGNLGQIRKHYTFHSKKDISVKNNRFYLTGKKIKANDWLVAKEDWKRAIEFYSSGKSLLDELQDE